jgi:hypothetical protein
MVDLSMLRALVPILATEPLSGKEFLRYAPGRGLLEQVANRVKTGFSVPVQDWVARHVMSEYPRSFGRGPRGWALNLAREVHLNN